MPKSDNYVYKYIYIYIMLIIYNIYCLFLRILPDKLLI